MAARAVTFLRVVEQREAAQFLRAQLRAVRQERVVLAAERRKLLRVLLLVLLQSEQGALERDVWCRKDPGAKLRTELGRIACATELVRHVSSARVRHFVRGQERAARLFGQGVRTPIAIETAGGSALRVKEEGRIDDQVFE